MIGFERVKHGDDMRTPRQESAGRLPPVKAIRKYCKTECAGSAREARLCTVSTCPLYSYRLGKNPARTGIGVGRRSPEGLFLPSPARSTGGIFSGKASRGMDWGSASSNVPRANGGKGRAVDVEKLTGDVRIQKTSYGMVIRLTQSRQSKPRTHAV